MYDDITEAADRISFSAKNPKRDIHREAELRISERMSADAKLTFKEAMRLVFGADPVLHRAYLNNAPPLRR